MPGPYGLYDAEIAKELANARSLKKTLDTILENSYEGIVIVDKMEL